MQGQFSTRLPTLGERIRALRGELSQEQFSQRVGLTRSALANYETNRTRPKRGTLRRIAEETGAPLRFLTDGELQVQDLLEMSKRHGEDDLGLWRLQTPLSGEDEMSILRLLRLMPPETMKKIASLISREVTEHSATLLRDADLTYLGRDLNVLFELKSSGTFNKPMRPSQLERLFAAPSEPRSKDDEQASPSPSPKNRPPK